MAAATMGLYSSSICIRSKGSSCVNINMSKEIYDIIYEAPDKEEKKT